MNTTKQICEHFDNQRAAQTGGLRVRQCKSSRDAGHSYSTHQARTRYANASTNPCPMITRPGPYQNPPWPRPLIAPVHQRQSPRTPERSTAQSGLFIDQGGASRRAAAAPSIRTSSPTPCPWADQTAARTANR